jgi:flagellar basal-body rod modification protein FlgD
MTNSIQSAALQGTTTGASSQTAASQPLGQDAFLKLLMAQLKNQDPLNPTDDTEFVTQLSQFSLVEQSVQQSTQLTTLGTQLQSLDNSNSTVLVGQQVTVGGGSLSWGGTYAAKGNVTLGGAAQSVTAIITDSSGNAVRTMNLGPQQAGPLSIAWNGLGDAGQAEPSGTYNLAVTAASSSGQSVSVSQNVTGVVSAVTFAQGSPSVTLSNGTVAPVSSLVSVGTTPSNP